MEDKITVDVIVMNKSDIVLVVTKPFKNLLVGDIALLETMCCFGRKKECLIFTSQKEYEWISSETYYNFFEEAGNL